MPKFSLLPTAPIEQPVQLVLEVESDGDVRVDAVQGARRCELLRFTTDGSLALIVGGQTALPQMGFRVQEYATHIRVINALPKEQEYDTHIRVINALPKER